MEISLDSLPDDPAALRAMILAQQQKIAGIEASSRAYEALIQALKLTIARLKRQRYGSSSEKIDREIAQLELALEGLEMAGAAADATPESDELADDQAADAPREVITLDPGERCPDCGGALRLVAEDVAEILDFIAAKLKVVEIHRPKKSCRDCERMVQTPAQSKARRPLIRSPEGTRPAGPGGPADPARSGRARSLGTHPGREVRRSPPALPARRDLRPSLGGLLAASPPEIRSRASWPLISADIPRSTLVDWCGQAAAAVRPVANSIRAEVMATDRLHADDRPIRVLDPKMKLAGKERGVKEGRIWVYVRDDRPWGGQDPPAAAYWFLPDRKGEHPQKHLENFVGILQAPAGVS